MGGDREREAHNLAELLVGSENASPEGTGWVSEEIRVSHDIGQEVDRGIVCSLHCYMAVKHGVVRLRGAVLPGGGYISTIKTTHTLTAVPSSGIA